MAASRVAAGIAVSRLLGLVRNRVFAHYFGTGDLADVWNAALRIPNVVQNLLGEGSLSASFIPVYVRLLEEGREEEAGRVAGAVLGLLALTAGLLAAVGVWAAPVLANSIAVGFSAEGRAALIPLLRLLFPMTGVLVISAWALGILNSHRSFFVAYVAPALWNLSMIVTLLVAGAWGLMELDLLVALAWGALAGGVLQLLFHLPFLMPHLRGVVLSLGRRLASVSVIVRNFVPVVVARGAATLSGLLDVALGSLLAAGAVAAMGYAQPIYLLPISLFGMSVAAAALPELSRDSTAGRDRVRARAEQAVGTVLFWLVPSTAGYMVFGPEVMGILYQTGEFTGGDAQAVGLILAAYAVGLPATGTSRVLSSTFYALGDTRTPARIAYVRIAVSVAVGASVMFPLDRFSVGGLGMGAAGLAAGASVGAWLELLLLRRSLVRRLRGLSFGGRRVLVCVLAAAVATGAGLATAMLLPPLHPALAGSATLLPFGIMYLLVAHRLGASPAGAAKLLRRLRGRGDDDEGGAGG
ncbi:MAG: murein biosynthesis integral membrane protein MurJ [Gemmatimonadetes bacterium]|nr:murein biosynthesis integral membrane protein MurJ [Gemmatimonadota bacterium]